MSDIVMPAVVLAATGGGLGLILAVVAKFMAVPSDEIADAILEVLPGVNCGACGYVGCAEYSEVLAKQQEENINKCIPGGNLVASSVGKILGIEPANIEPVVADIRCSGTCDKAKDEFIFEGIPSCAVCSGYFDGKGMCDYGCIGYGDCVKVCAYGALYLENGIAHVDRDLCTGCGMCAKVCPMEIIQIDIKRNFVKVECSSFNKGAFVRQACTAGCIGCKRCEKECEFDAIKVENNLAYIDPEKCTNCGKCANVCPTKVIKIYS